MSNFGDPIDEELEDFDEAPIAEDEVISAARSCSAIIVIVVIVGAILCIMLGIALVYK
jgi:hypothetical protein